MDITSASDLCAFCLEQTSEMYSLQAKSVVDLAKYSLNIDVLNFCINKYPEFVCSGCLIKLKDAKKLKNGFKKVHRQLDLIIKEQLEKEILKEDQNQVDVIEEPLMQTEISTKNNCSIRTENKQKVKSTKMIFRKAPSSKAPDKPAEPSIECFICHMTFATKVSKKHHLTFKHKESLKCIHCQVSLESSFKLDQHIKKTHQKFHTFICEVCGRGFEFKHYLAKHTHLKHEQKKAHSCDICGSKILVKSNLHRHMRLHRELKFDCNQCSISYSTKNGLNNHLFQVHNVEPPLKCLNCNRGFTYLSELETHQRNLKMKKTCKPFKPSQSRKLNKNMEFDYSIDRANHIFKCKLCDKVYSYSGSLFVHMEATHSGQVFDCQHCGKTFKNSNNKRRHEGTHLTDKQFACEHCDKKFHQKNQVLIHERIHTGVTPFKCTVCGKKFADPSVIRKHMRNLHDIIVGQPGSISISDLKTEK